MKLSLIDYVLHDKSKLRSMMMLFGISVKKIDDKVIIRWQFSKIEIPISDILQVTLDDTYGGKERNAIRIGTANSTTDRVVIKKGTLYPIHN